MAAKYNFIDRNRRPADLEVVLSFICPHTKKSYVLVKNKTKIFSANSKYENLDIMEISSHTGNNLTLRAVASNEWDIVKDFFYKNICGRIKSNVAY